jgi:hypothetical protein
VSEKRKAATAACSFKLSTKLHLRVESANNEWTVVEDNFWRPQLIEVNYDAGRKMSTFQPADYSLGEFPPYSSLPQLCNSTLVVMRIIQAIRLINKKFSECVSMHHRIISGSEPIAVDSPIKGSLTGNPSLMYEYKMELELIIFLMRRVLDSLVQLTDMTVNFDNIEKSKKIKFDSIGSVLNKKTKDKEVSKIICGRDEYLSDTTGFLIISNDLFNGFKHTLMNDESFNLIGETCPTIVGYSVKYSNHKEHIQYHNHNAYHIMMGFQDCITRIIENQKIFLTKLTKKSR